VWQWPHAFSLRSAQPSRYDRTNKEPVSAGRLDGRLEVEARMKSKPRPGMRDDMDASRLGRVRYRKKLNELLSIADDEGFSQLIWAADALQSGRAIAVQKYLEFPPEAADAQIGNPYFVGSWDMETLFNELLVIPKATAPRRVLNYRHFNGLIGPVNNLRKLENAESGLVLRRMNILWELPRIAYRQFHWQRGYMNQPQFYRWHFLFSGNRCRAYFLAKHGITAADLALVGFGLYGHFQRHPTMIQRLRVPELALDEQTAAQASSLLSMSLEEARQKAFELRKGRFGVAYDPSVLRQSPVLKFGSYFRSPLPDLIIARVTAGIYYDVVDGPAEIRNEIAEKFEIYSSNLLGKCLPTRRVRRASKYNFRGREFETPDVIVEGPQEIDLIIECKSKKMTFEARFSENPLEDAQIGFDEMAKGIFQIWRFLSHLRRGAACGGSVSEGTTGMVLTLDNWMTASGDLQAAVVAKARQLAAEKDVEISEADMRPVIFCPIESLESALAHGTEQAFLSAVVAAKQEQFRGWDFANIQAEVAEKTEVPYPFHHQLGEVLPWWKRLKELNPNENPADVSAGGALRTLT